MAEEIWAFEISEKIGLQRSNVDRREKKYGYI